MLVAVSAPGGAPGRGGSEATGGTVGLSTARALMRAALPPHLNTSHLFMRSFFSRSGLARSTAVACALGLATSPAASAQDGARAAERAVADRFDRVDDLAWSAERGVPVFLAGPLRAPSSASPVAIAEAFLDEQAALLRTADRVGFAVERVDADAAFGSSHVRVMQEVAGVPVFGAESIVHVDPQGAVYAYSGTVYPDAAGVATTPAVDAREALAAAKAWLPKGSVIAADAVTMPEDGPLVAVARPAAPEARLVVYPVAADADGEAIAEYRLAYHVDLSVEGAQMARWQVFVDAETGRVFHAFNAIHTATERDVDAGFALGVDLSAQATLVAEAPTVAAYAGAVAVADGPTSSSGSSLYRGRRTFGSYLYQGAYYLYDLNGGADVRTYYSTSNGTGRGNWVTDGDGDFRSNAQKPAVDVHWGVRRVYNYFKNTHDRLSYDGNNAFLQSRINAQFWTGSGYSPNNASWNGYEMAYGNGDGSTFRPLVDLDITAHELTHGVTEYTAGLIYQNASGALNEAVSDIMAVMVDRDDWKIGEQSYTPGTSGDALRYMNNPPAGNQPDNYGSRYTGTGDRGGVHINSGIFNKAAYMMAAGGTFRGVSVSGIGRGRTERIWYRALSRYFGSSTGYSGARSGCIQAASDLYGANSWITNSVRNAFASVGIGAQAFTEGGGTNAREATAETMLRAGDVPAELALTGAYPNPTSGLATVAFALPEAADVELAAYDVLGRRVAVLASGTAEAGTHEAALDATALPAGLYVVRLQAGERVLAQRITVTR